MKMEFEIISKELIKPCSPTPSHLKTYKFSVFDQFMPPVYTPLTLFYNNNINSNSSSLSLILKKSLSETLSLFYPLAGKLKDALSIDCNDDGLHYTTAKVLNTSLSDYLNQTHHLPSSLYQLLQKLDQGGNINPESYVCLVQETCFPCGGIAIGLQVLHLAMDGISMFSFLKTWASIANSGYNKAAILSNLHEYPFIDASSMFPPSNDFPMSEMLTAFRSLLRSGELGTRRFVFDASAIDRLKAKATSLSVGNPTRVEAVSSLLFRRNRAASKAKSVSILYIVNIGKKFDPPLPDYSMGNFIWMLQTKSDETEVAGLVSDIRRGFRGIDMEFVKKIKGCDKEFLKLQVEKIEELGGSDETEFIGCTSWINLVIYEIDFGWGKPIWVTCVNHSTLDNTQVPFVTSIYLLDAKTGKGIEAYVHSSVQDLNVLEKDEELLTYALLNPSPLK